MLHLYDGNYFCHRLYHGMPKLTNSKGKPVGMLVGAASALHELAGAKTPGPTLFAFDKGKCKWRRELVPTYKANRVHDPEIGKQIEVVKAMVSAYGIFTYQKLGVEADDIIGSVTRIATVNHNEKVTIHTGDKDMNQLVKGSKAVVQHPVTGAVMDEKALMKKFGIKPIHFIDYLALMGDDTDGYPGLPGCGPKTALTLIQSGVTVASILSNPANAGKLAAAAKKHKKALAANYEVAKIKRMLKMPFSIEDCRPSSPDLDKLTELFEKWELTAALKRVAKLKNRPKNLFS